MPAQLPADVAGFSGRRDVLARLDGLLARGPGRQTAVVISAVSGTAGVGKTALAVHWAHGVADRFPDGQLYVNLRGFDPGGTVMDPAEAVRGFLDALGVPPDRVPAEPDAQAALYRSLVAGKRLLIVLDNARDAEQVRPLLPGTSTAMVLVTSRDQLTALVAAVGAEPVALDLLSPAEARDLLTRRLGSAVTRAATTDDTTDGTTDGTTGGGPGGGAGEVAAAAAGGPDAVEQIITACARLPLALTIAAARARQTGFPLDVIAAELREAGVRLDALDAGDTSSQVRAVFSWSYAALSEDAARMFRLLGLHPGPDVTVPAAASLAAQPPGRARRALAELVRANLITEHAPGRYTFHDLLRAYAAEQARAYDAEPERRAATHRLLDHYLHTSYAGARLLNPFTEPIALDPPAPGVSVVRLPGHDAALAWYGAELAGLLAAVHHAGANGFDAHAWQLAWAVDEFLGRRARWLDVAAISRVALAAARRLGEPAAQAGAHRNLARAVVQLARFDEAHAELRRALALYRQAGDRVAEAYTHLSLGVMWGRRRRYAEALHHPRQALRLFRETGHRRGQAKALNMVGWCHALQGDHRHALICCGEALTLFREIEDRPGQADALDSLGFVHQHLGERDRAIACYREAHELFLALSDRPGEAVALEHLGDLHQEAGDLAAAREAWQRALDILDEVEHRDAAGVRAKLETLGP